MRGLTATPRQHAPGAGGAFSPRRCCPWSCSPQRAQVARPARAWPGGDPRALPPRPPASSDRRAQALASSQCMRNHGISDFPDPDAEGQVNNPQLEEARNTVAEAEEACKDLSPEGDGGSTKDQAAALERALAYSQCMRDHGISGFPDPAYSNGGVVIPKNGKYDPLDPAVQQAHAALPAAPNPAHTPPTDAARG